MKKAFLLISACLLHIVANAQNFTEYLNSVFPIQNTVTTDYPEYTGTNVSMSYDYLGKRIYLSSLLYLFKGEEHYNGYGIKNLNQALNRDLGSFMSFSYYTKRDTEVSGPWNSSSEATQFAFHPGGAKTPKGDSYNYGNSEKPYYTPLYVFTYSDSEGLNLVDLENSKVIANLGGGGDITKYAYLSVFSGKNRSSEDIIVVAGKGNFNVYGTFVGNGESGVRQITYSGTEPSYFGINGQKYDSPQQGLNIVVNGSETKKVIIK